MTYAFDYYGAAAFVGSTIPIYAVEGYKRAFWKELCQNDGTVEDAVDALCAAAFFFALVFPGLRFVSPSSECFSFNLYAYLY